ncbi:hypothetical protein J1N35_025401 [Gossypium stocksii]|uniref:Uncharacterized protein n=1 Tax=Gossypium stocksii TaxID=47602 RepID=A0A9D3V7N6_9ROSI|nr:hypothetical protein J1N35_025401 [Gossypium stocksii]
MPDKDLMREFNFNLTMLEANEILVRKKKGLITSKSINDLFNLLDVEKDEYSTMMTNITWDFLQQDPNELQKERSINVGRIILKEVQDYIRKKAGSAYFPSLITSLCLRVHVRSKVN